MRSGKKAFAFFDSITVFAKLQRLLDCAIFKRIFKNSIEE